MKRRVLLGVLALTVCARPVGAHPLAPALLELRERAGSVTEVLWKTPLLKPTGEPIAPRLPATCRAATAPAMIEEAGNLATRWSVRCEAGWIGQTLWVEGLAETGTSALVRLELTDGRVLQALLSGSAGSFTVPERTSATRVFTSYLGLGLRHLLTGPDHLLFVLGLLLLVPLGRPLLLTISAFTLGHSVTLSAAILGWVTVPQAPIEIAIAASIAVLAAELAARAEGHRTGLSRRPWAMALAFGLLHGLGFAGALAAIGLPVGELPLALLAFNLGIEIGQLVWIAAFAALGGLMALAGKRAPLWAARAAAYGIGSVAALWCLERIPGLS